MAKLSGVITKDMLLKAIENNYTLLMETK
jgi:hypothetical protein